MPAHQCSQLAVKAEGTKYITNGLPMNLFFFLSLMFYLHYISTKFKSTLVLLFAFPEEYSAPQPQLQEDIHQKHALESLVHRK